ncbi:MAG: hypothetical protein IT383_14935 [Deltaproteobacteria bacterium]|nr:hypothetical protein [Deltaproteobacteria bacterium]
MKVGSGPKNVQAPRRVARRDLRAAIAQPSAVAEAPLPSTKEFAQRRPAKGGVPLWAAYVASKGDRPASLTRGLRALDRRLSDIARLSAQGVKVRCVFDLDNTLFDTRWRTLACARSFDLAHGTGHFAGLKDDELIGFIGKNGRDTALALKLPPDVVERFAAHWDVAFWRPEALAFDRPMDPPLHLIAEAMQRGAQVVFLSGRVERHIDAQGNVFGFRDASLAQLRAAGIEVAPEQLLLKPDVATRTAGFKAEVLRRYDDEGEIGFFLTEGIRDTTQVRAALPECTCFLLDCSFEQGARPPGVPLLPGRF